MAGFQAHFFRFYGIMSWAIHDALKWLLVFSISFGLIILRERTDINSGYTDSVWLQVDGQIGKSDQSIHAGNWLDVHPAGIYGWAGDMEESIHVVLKHSGDHTIRIQPRQTPHRIDQIWLSRWQQRIPNTTEFIK